MNNYKIDVIIPALNEEKSIANVITDIPHWVRNIIVVDNGSTDKTAEVAQKSGACVVHEPLRGYGAACLKGISVLDNPDIVVFLDGDYSDRPQQMDRLVVPIIRGEAEMVIGSRVLGSRERGALTPQARFGNWLACHLIFAMWRVRYSDLGPFRAISFPLLMALYMKDKNYGWTIEMQIKAAIKKIPFVEVAVDYHKRIGKSKISGTVSGVIGAGYKILSTIFIYALKKKPTKQKRIILFSKYPLPGKAKTRMIPALGDVGAAKLQKEMTESIISRLRLFSHKHKTHVEVRFYGGDEEQMRSWLGGDLLYRPQKGSDLGQKMYEAFLQSFREDAPYCVIIGADCPEVSEETLLLAFFYLKYFPLVIGPAKDGGYYLIAMRKRIPQIFQGINWGTKSVFRTTIEIAERNQISYKLLPSLHDIDVPADLVVWENLKNQQQKSFLPKISVIVPCLNEQNNIRRCLRSVVGGGIECIVVDGGSTDKTAEIVGTFPDVKYVSTSKGRARQLNYGAKRASGEILLFLHADSELPVSFAEQIRETFWQKSVVGGAFSIKLGSEDREIKRMEAGINRRSHRFSLPYGDQGIFVRRSTFERLQGFPQISILEDVVFVMRLRKLGKIKMLKTAVRTSARKWERTGPWRTWFINQCIIIGFIFGFPHDFLRRWYD